MEELKIVTSSDLDFEGMVIDIMVSNTMFAKLHCDDGIEKTKVLIYHNNAEKPFIELNYLDLVNALEESFAKLKEANLIDD